MSSSAFFFDRLDGPLISMELGRPRVVMPGPEYPGDPDWWESGFSAYVLGWPMRNGNRPIEEAESWMHGYLTARMADLMGAVVPDPLPDVESATVRDEAIWEDLFWGEEDSGCEEEGGEVTEFTADELCPVDEEKAPAEREAWMDGFLGRGGSITFVSDYGGLGDPRYHAFQEGQKTRYLVENGEVGDIPTP